MQQLQREIHCFDKKLRSELNPLLKSGIYCERSLLHFQAQQYSDALVDINRALLLTPGNVILLQQAAEISYSLLDFQNCIKHARTALSLLLKQNDESFQHARLESLIRESKSALTIRETLKLPHRTYLRAGNGAFLGIRPDKSLGFDRKRPFEAELFVLNPLATFNSQYALVTLQSSEFEYFTVNPSGQVVFTESRPRDGRDVLLLRKQGDTIFLRTWLGSFLQRSDRDLILSADPCALATPVVPQVVLNVHKAKFCKIDQLESLSIDMSEINVGDIVDFIRVYSSGYVIHHTAIWAGRDARGRYEVIHKNAPDGMEDVFLPGLRGCVLKGPGLVTRDYVSDVLKESDLAFCVLRFPAYGSGRLRPDAVIRRAMSKIGPQEYDLLNDNCQHFVTWAVFDKSFSFQLSTGEIARNEHLHGPLTAAVGYFAGGVVGGAIGGTVVNRFGGGKYIAWAVEATSNMIFGQFQCQWTSVRTEWEI